MQFLSKKWIFIGCFFSILLLVSLLRVIQIPTQTKISSRNTTLSSDDHSFNKTKSSSVPYSNITVVSDGYEDLWNWNNGHSEYVSITNDDFGNIHAVWSDETDTKYGYDAEIMYAKWTTSTGWSNASIISDGYKNQYWNDDNSQKPSIAADHLGNLYVVWYDDTNNLAKWGSDIEIMFTNWTAATGEWSNASVISDGYKDHYWNNNQSLNPSIAVDGSGNIHVVWEDITSGKWKYSHSDWEIMYANWTAATGEWSNVSVISDGYQGKYWNTDHSWFASIAVESSGNVHIVWQDDTNNYEKWRTDSEIMYANWTAVTGEWSNVSVISDGYKGIWNNRNDGNSQKPSIAVDSTGNIHVVWEDISSGIWHTDSNDWEIMYANWTLMAGWSNFSVISDGYNNIWGWNNEPSSSPSIDVDDSGNVYVAWYDNTDNTATWGTDTEIIYVKGTIATGWSNASIISDGYQGKYWNDESSQYPSIAVDCSGNVHIAWDDNTDNTATWGSDREIMCVIIPSITTQLLIGGDDDDNDDDKEGRIIYGYNVILLITAISSISIIYLTKKYKKYKKNFIND